MADRCGRRSVVSLQDEAFGLRQSLPEPEEGYLLIWLAASIGRTTASRRNVGLWDNAPVSPDAKDRFQPSWRRGRGVAKAAGAWPQQQNLVRAGSGDAFREYKWRRGAVQPSLGSRNALRTQFLCCFRRLTYSPTIADGRGVSTSQQGGDPRGRAPSGRGGAPSATRSRGRVREADAPRRWHLKNPDRKNWQILHRRPRALRRSAARLRRGRRAG